MHAVVAIDAEFAVAGEVGVVECKHAVVAVDGSVACDALPNVVGHCVVVSLAGGSRSRAVPDAERPAVNLLLVLLARAHHIDLHQQLADVHGLGL